MSTGQFMARTILFRPILSAPFVYSKPSLLLARVDRERKDDFRFLHVSTDEVYGSLDPTSPPFTETNRYEPNSPYSASKAASDHLVRAYHHTYGLPVLTTNCSNNYGPYQFPEKLIPLCIHNALAGKALAYLWRWATDSRLAVCGGPLQLNPLRIWQMVVSGEVYNVGGWNEKSNLEVVHTICDILDELVPPGQDFSFSTYRSLITYVTDRPGHDRRYAIDAAKIEHELALETGGNFCIRVFDKTVRWYLDHQDWVANITSGKYRDWVEKQYSS